MSKNSHRPKYDSSRSREDYTLHPARRFDLEWQPDPGKCHLYALDERTAMMLRKMVAVFPKYYWVWGLSGPQRSWEPETWQLWQEIQDFVSEVEACLVSGCDMEALIKTNRMVVAALTGEGPLDLTDPAVLSPDAVDYSETGIGPILAKIHAIEDEKYFDLDDFLTDLTSNPFDTTKDLLEFLTFVKELAPSGFRIDLGQLIRDFKTMRYRSAIHDQVMDIALSQRAQALAQGGLDYAGIYDIVSDTVNTALLPAGILGKVTWLWSQLKWKDIPGWATWVGQITALILGNIRGALYDINQTIEDKDILGELDLSGVVTALGDISGSIPDYGDNLDNMTDAINSIDPVINVTCKQCGSSGGCGCAGGSGIPDPGGNGATFQPDPADGQPTGGGGPGGNGVPPAFDGTQGEYSGYKCKAANFIFDSIFNGLVYLGGLSTLGAAVGAGVSAGTWLLSVMVASSSYSTVLGGAIIWTMVAGWEIAIFVAAIAAITAVFGLVILEIFADLADELLQDKEDIICDLYDAQTVDEAQTVVSDALTTSITNFVISSPYNSIESLIRSTLSSVIGTFLPNTLFNKLFQDDPTVHDYTPSYTACCNCEHSIPYGTLVSDDGSDIQISATPWSGGYRAHITFFDQCEPATITGHSLISGTLTNHPGAIKNWRIFSFDEPSGVNNDGDVYNDDAPPSGYPYNYIRTIVALSDDAFTIQFSYESEV